MSKQLRYAGISGVVSVTLSIIVGVIATAYSSKLTTQPFWTIYLTLTISSLITYLIFINGFRLLGNYIQERKLVIIAWLGILSAIIQIVPTILMSRDVVQSLPIVAIFIFIFYGIISIPVGIVFLKMSVKLGPTATTIGKLNIAIAVAMISVILTPIGIILAMISSIYESFLLLNQANQISKSKT